MSRTGNAPVNIPEGVSIDFSGRSMKVTGPKGELTVPIGRGIEVRQDDGTLVFERESEAKVHKAHHGLTRALTQNAVTGVTEGFSKTLQITGVGYRAQLSGGSVNLQVGLSHPVAVSPREGVELEVPNPGTVVVRGIDKELVGQVAAEIRRVKPPEPYKGKGIRYEGEEVRSKAGKAG